MTDHLTQCHCHSGIASSSDSDVPLSTFSSMIVIIVDCMKFEEQEMRISGVYTMKASEGMFASKKNYYFLSGPNPDLSASSRHMLLNMNTLQASKYLSIIQNNNMILFTM